MNLQTKSQKRKSFAQVLLTEGEPIMMRLKKGKWYSAFHYKMKWVGVSLDAYEKEVSKAHLNLADVIRDCKEGRVPNGTRKKIRLIKPINPFKKEYADIRKNYIDPFFGEMKPNELTSTLMEQYIESRWGRNDDGNLQAMERTLKGEMFCLRKICEAVDENFNFHKRLLNDLKYVSLYRDLLQPLTREQIDLAWEQAKKARGGVDYKRAFWIMVWTGMEAMDICDLKPNHFVNIKGEEWLVKERHKTMLQKTKTIIKVPVLPEFKKILSEVLVPLDKNAPYFSNLNNDSCNDAIGKWFDRTGLKGYGSKYLRRHLGELALDLGQSETWVQQALGHAFDSKVTRKYMRVREGSMIDVFEKLAKHG